MSGPIQISQVPVTASTAIESMSTLFRGEAVRIGLIVRDGQGLALQIMHERMPLPDSFPLKAGQPVNVRFAEANPVPTLHISPRPNSSPPPSSATPPQQSNAVAAVLQQIGALSQENVARANALLPSWPQLPEAAVRALLTLFMGRAATGRALQVIAETLRVAAEAGVVTRELARELEAFSGRMRADDAASLRAAIAAARSVSGRSYEAVLARLASGRGMHAENGPDELLLLRLSELNRNSELATLLKNSGDASRFFEALDSFLEHARGSQMQNLRSLQSPYQFLNLPLHPESGFNRAQIHYLSEDGGGENTESGEGPATLAIDLSLSNLGELWIVIRSYGEQCDCQFRASNSEVVALINDRAEELSEALGAVGYGRVSVRAQEWEGDRLEAVADLIAGHGGIDLNA